MLVYENTIIPVTNFSITDESRHGEIFYVDQTKRLTQYKIHTFPEWSISFDFYGLNTLWHNPITGASTNSLKTYYWYDYNKTVPRGTSVQETTLLTIPAIISTASLSFDRVLKTSLTLLGQNSTLSLTSAPDITGFTVLNDFNSCYTPLQTKIWVDGAIKFCKDTTVTFNNLGARIETTTGSVVVPSVPSCVVTTTVFADILSISSIRIQFGDDSGVLWDKTYSGVGKLTRSGFKTDVSLLVNM